MLFLYKILYVIKVYTYNKNGGHHDFNYIIYLFCIRLISLKISINHSQQLKADGAVEYGVNNSKFLAITHVFIYVCAGVEALLNKDTFSLVNGIGLMILILHISCYL